MKQKICEMCGKRTNKLYKVLIEGAILYVCEDCAKYGTIVDEEGKPVKNILSKPQREIRDIVETVVEDYYNILRRYRQEHGLTQEEMAKRIGIKYSLYKSIEEGKIVPDIKTAKKIERALGVKLITKDVIYTSEASSSESEGLRVKDIIDIDFEL